LLLTELGAFVAGDAANMPALTGLENSGFIRDIYMAKKSTTPCPVRAAQSAWAGWNGLFGLGRVLFQYISGEFETLFG